MTTSPTVTVVSRAAARKLASNLAGCGALSATSTTTSSTGQKAEAIASGTSSATQRCYLQGIRVPVAAVRSLSSCVSHHDGPARQLLGAYDFRTASTSATGLTT